MLKSVEFDNFDGVLGNGGFNGCCSLAIDPADFSYPNNIIKDSTFYGCSLITSVVDTSIVGVESNAFYCDYRINNVVLDNCTTIGTSAFEACSALTSLNFPSLTSVGSRSFFGCSSVSSFIAPNCTSVQTHAFADCLLLRNLTLGLLSTVGGTESSWVSRAGVNLTPDESGFKCIVTIQNTMSSLRSLFNFKYTEKQTKFVCSDGYISYENGAWTDHAN